MLFSPLVLSLLIAALLSQIAVFSTTIYLHRAAAHKALSLHPAVALVFRACLWMTTGICTREWVAKRRDVIARYASDMPEDKWERLLFRRGYFGPLLGTTALALLIGPGWALLAAALHGVGYVFVLSPAINGLCHYRGYKNFDNTAFNIRLVALLTAGEGLHNNHHGAPRSPKFSLRPSEIDLAWPVIRFLSAIRLATPNKTIEHTRQGSQPVQAW